MVTRRIARPLLASVFIAGGLDQLRRPGDKAAVSAPLLDAVQEAAAPVTTAAAEQAATAVDQAADAVEETTDRPPDADGGTTGEVVAEAADVADRVRTTIGDVAAGRRDLFDDEALVRANGAVQLGAGLLLATNRMPRVASAALAVTLVPTTLGGHRWWEAQGTERAIQRFNFLKNVALLGGLILAAADTEGEPSLAWRLRHAGKDGKLAARAAKANAAVAAHAAAADAKAATRLAKANAKAAGTAGELGVEVAGRRARKAAKAASKIAEREGHHLAERASALVDQVGPKLQTSELVPRLQAAGHAAADRAGELTPPVQAAAQRAADLTPKVQAAAQRASAALPSAS
jgi:uncharacterized membrane protein YphA (DoxX/SURF4 family)